MFGFLCCNKPSGMTSRDLVNMVQGNVRRIQRNPTPKVGHAGTLDPLATGVLVIGVGIANRLTQYVQDQPKRYRTSMRLGASSVSGDLEETVVEHPELSVPTLEQLRQAAETMVGEISQQPPAHSAVWVDGKRAYDRVRRGETVVMPSRQVEIHSIEILGMVDREVEFDVVCGSGTYIRSLVMDLAGALGTRAVMTGLVRTAIGSFSIEDAITAEQVRHEPVTPYLRPLINAAIHMPRLQVDDHDVTRLRNGLFVNATTPIVAPDGSQSHADEAAFVDSDGNLRGIVRRVDGDWRPYRVFHEP